MTPTQAATLAAIIWNVRADWPQTSLHSFIVKNLADKPYPLVTVAFVACAVDPATKTPARVLEAGPWWRAAQAAFEQPQAAPDNATLDHRCSCGMWVVRGENHQCSRRADNAQGAAKARQALDTARQAAFADTGKDT